MSTTIGPSERNRRVVEALVLALGSSEIAKIVNVGTLRYFIEFTLRDMLSGTVLDLGPLWNTLSAEPGLTPEMIFPPLLRFHSWGQRLGITVSLPPPIANLGADETETYLARCQVADSELERALGQAAGGQPADRRRGQCVPSASAPRSAVPQRSTPRLSEEYLRPRGAAVPADEEGEEEPSFRPSETATPKAAGLTRRVVLVTSVVVALASLAFVGYRLVGHHGSRLPIDSVREILMLENARRVDYAVTAVVADPRWKTMSRDERRKALEAVFSTLEGEGVKTLILRGPSGESLATLSTVGGSRVVKVE